MRGKSSLTSLKSFLYLKCKTQKWKGFKRNLMEASKRGNKTNKLLLEKRNLIQKASQLVSSYGPHPLARKTRTKPIRWMKVKNANVWVWGGGGEKGEARRRVKRKWKAFYSSSPSIHLPLPARCVWRNSQRTQFRRISVKKKVCVKW